MPNLVRPPVAQPNSQRYKRSLFQQLDQVFRGHDSLGIQRFISFSPATIDAATPIIHNRKYARRLSASATLREVSYFSPTGLPNATANEFPGRCPGLKYFGPSARRSDATTGRNEHNHF